MSEPDPLLNLAEKITDEHAVDWVRERAAHPETERVLQQLQSLEKLAFFQRGVHAPSAPEEKAALFHWGPLRALEKLGEGGFAEVYRAWDPTLHREVALKLRRTDPGAADAGSRHWLEEARRLARVRHEHVVTIHGADVHDGRAGLWMERVTGKTLEAVLDDHGPLSARETLGVGIELCAALAAVHAAGLVHGDVKTTNVMRELGGRVVLMDFGAGSELVPGDREGAPVAFATPLFSAPEVLLGRGIRVESDLYALGVLLYRLVTGRHYVKEGSAEEIRGRIERGEIVPLRDVRPDLPAEFIQVVSHALEGEPEDRFPSAGAMEAALVHALAMLTDHGHGAAPATRIPAASIAVLPLANLSDEGDYFADGLTEELLNHLGRIPGFRVAGRSSSFRFKGKSEDLREIGRKLNVETVLEGSVRRSGPRLRIAVRLAHAADGFQLWSQSYDRELGDVFAIQEEIGQAVAAALKVALQRTNAARSRPVAGQAYDSALLGRYFLRRATREGLQKAAGHLENAVAIDSGFALAWAGLALVRIRQAGHGHAPLEETFRKAREAIERALAIDPELPDAHTALGQIKLHHDWDWTGAAVAFRRAMELDPGHAGCVANAAMAACSLGRTGEALDLGQRACELDPLSVAAWSNQGLFCWYAGREADAVANFRKALELDPHFPLTHAKLGRVFLTAGRLDEALFEMQAEKSDAFQVQGLSMVSHAMGRTKESDAYLAELVQRHEAGGAFQIAEAYAFRGELDQAFDWLERAHGLRDAGLVTMKGRPLLRNLEADRRWRAFLAKMGLPA